MAEELWGSAIQSQAWTQGRATHAFPVCVERNGKRTFQTLSWSSQPAWDSIGVSQVTERARCTRFPDSH